MGGALSSPLPPAGGAGGGSAKRWGDRSTPLRLASKLASLAAPPVNGRVMG